MLPKSLDGDSAGSVVTTTPPVLSTAEALFTRAPEHVTTWPTTTSFLVRVWTNNAKVIQQQATLLFDVELKATVSKRLEEVLRVVAHILSLFDERGAWWVVLGRGRDVTLPINLVFKNRHTVQL